MRNTPLALVAIFCLTLAPAAHAQFGLAAGLNFDRMGDIEARDASATFENASGYHVGAFFDLGVGPLAIRPGLFYRNIQNIEAGGDLDRRTFDLNLVEIPIDFRVRAMTPIVRPYVLAGPVIRFASTRDDDFEDMIENLSMAGNLGAGVEVALPGTGLRFFPELRYSFGLTRFTKDEFTIGGVNFRSEGRQSDSSVMLRLGIGF
jgi:hypothetical protein